VARASGLFDEEASQMDGIGKASTMVPRARIELATPRFSGACSTD
jgi:hypothetical protein